MECTTDMIEQMFLGRTVRVIDFDLVATSEMGECSAVEASQVRPNVVRVWVDGCGYDLEPDVIQATSIEGRVHVVSGRRRKVELVAN